MRREDLVSFGALVGVACLAAVAHLLGGFEWVERHVMDARFSLARRPVAGHVVVVAIDPKSLQALSVWPWPRGYHATVLERLLEAGAARVAFDLDFSSRSLDEEDAAFEQALVAAEGRVVLSIFHQWQTEPDGTVKLVTARPLPAFGTGAELAAINVKPESDGVIRRYAVESAETDPVVPTLAAALLPRPAQAPPRDFYIDYSLDVASIPQISYLDVLTGEFDPRSVRGRAVIVGATALELGDQAPVPVHATLAGPMLQALALESLAGGRALRRLPEPAVSLACLVLAVACGPVLLRGSWRRGLVVVAAGGGAVLAVSLVVERLAPVMVDLTPLAATLAGGYAVALVRRLDQQGLRLMLEALRAHRSEQRMMHVVQNCSEAIITVGEDQRVESFNKAAETMLEMPPGRAIGSRFDALIPGGLGPAGDPGVAPSGDGAPPSPSSPWQREVILEAHSDSPRTLDMKVSRFPLEGRDLHVVFLRDITVSKQQHAALEHQATHDSLTGLPNRFLLRIKMGDTLRQKDAVSPAALLMVDLDRFKEVNDTLGHETGDLLLRQLADRLRQTLRGDETLARLGGDEFALFLPHGGRLEAQRLARDLIEALRAPFEIRRMMLQVDASVGIALSPEHGREVSMLMKRADVAMYIAKKQRNTYAFYDPEADFNSVRHLTLRGEMLRAIEENRFALYYQPKVDLMSGELVGTEALLRWPHPRHGLLPPSEFIPSAESTGLIKPITRWVINHALAQSAEWRLEGLELPIAVNCSARNLLEEDLPASIESALREYSVTPSRLVMEITETALIEDPQRSLEVLQAMAALGVTISIDDFGTAYSSLDYLRKLPAHELKIDGSFIKKIEQSESDATIVRAIVHLAHDLGLKAVAEGIESDASIEMLRTLGCDQGQGYWISPPVPPAGLFLWEKARRKTAGASQQGLVRG